MSPAGRPIPPRMGLTWQAHAGAVTIGLLAFLLLVGPRVLIPQNIGWLAQGDMATHYLGWVFYRSAPWTFPPGLNPGYGLELGSSVIFSDSNALLAMGFKAVAGLLPQPFQYFGLWLLACYLLQAWFALRLVEGITPDIRIRLLAVAFFVTAPPLFARVASHMNLAGHFLVLAALGLVLRPRPRHQAVAWTALLTTAALVHAYLFAMVGLLWLADVAGRAWRRSAAARDLALEAVSVSAASALNGWLAGYLGVLDGPGAGGFGFYRMNLLSLVDANGGSYLLADLPGGAGDYEGAQFLGLGMMLLLACAIPALVQARTGIVAAVGRFPALVIACLVLTLFALSATWGLGSFSFAWPVPDSWIRLASVFHASGRMFWPVYYLIFLGIFFVVVRGYGHRVALVVLSLALVVQLADSSRVWWPVRQALSAPTVLKWPSDLRDPFWAAAAGHYRKIRWLQPGNGTPKWRSLAAYAAAHGLATDAVFLARVSGQALERAQAKAATAITTATYEGDALYVLDPALLAQVRQTLHQDRDLLAMVDGLHVLAPGWLQCDACKAASKSSVATPIQTPALEPGRRVPFGQGQPGVTMLGAGWAVPEAAAVWSSAAAATLWVPVASGAVTSVLVEAVPLVGGRVRQQRVAVEINGVPAGLFKLGAEPGGRLQIPVPPPARDAIRADGVMRLVFRFPDAARPVDLGMNSDQRTLAMALQALTVR